MPVNYQIVDDISIKGKSQVYLITIDNVPDFYVLKKYSSEAVISAFEQLRKIDSIYFPKIIDLWREDSVFCVIEEYVAGRTLREIIDEGEITSTEAIQYMVMLCKAMGTLHRHEPKLVHRDIKPENIIIDKKGKLMLIDFDAIRVHKSESYYDTTLMGTKEYASPEQFGFQQTDERSDIYSAGVVFRELINGLDKDKKEIRKICKIIDKATMFEPEKRYRNAELMLYDIMHIKNNKTIVYAICVPIIIGIVIGTFFLIKNKMSDGSINIIDTTTESTTDTPTIIDETESEETWNKIIEGAIYHWENNTWTFWGFVDGYEYPKEYYIESEIGGNKVTGIGAYALSGKVNIRKLHVPDSIIWIGESAFKETDLKYYGKKGSYIEKYCKDEEHVFIEE